MNLKHERGFGDRLSQTPASWDEFPMVKGTVFEEQYHQAVRGQVVSTLRGILTFLAGMGRNTCLSF